MQDEHFCYIDRTDIRRAFSQYPFQSMADGEQAPYGYNDATSGFMGATLILSGIVSAIITAPLFDRVFTHHLAVTSKVLVPCISVTWALLIWAGESHFAIYMQNQKAKTYYEMGELVRPHNTAVLFVLMAVIGICALTMLPVGLELACELTRNADGSSAILWFRSVSRTPLLCLVIRAHIATNESPP
jgi:hypothetical protein